MKPKLESDSDDDGGNLSSNTERDEDEDLMEEKGEDKREVNTLSAQTNQKKKRKKFTDEEDGAIHLGVEKFGVGRWAEIKEYYSKELIDRTTINLKDRWRTLNK